MCFQKLAKKEHFFIQVFSIVLMLSATVVQATDEPVWQGKSFSATQFAFEKVLPEKKTKSKVYISAEGVRMESKQNPNSGIQNVISIFSFKTEKSWLIDPLQKVYVLMEGGEVADDEGDMGGIFSDKPCQGYVASKKIGSETIQGRSTTKWACKSEKRDVVVVQHYDPKLNVVIREDMDGEITELHDIKPGKQNKKLFQPPKSYRKVSMVEMMTGYMKLPKYKE